jgi:hypothetical protein
LAALAIYIWTHMKFDFQVPGYSPKEQCKTFHFTYKWKHTFYDTDLHINIPHAKHAISIDENRAAFARVGWGVPDGRPSRNAAGILLPCRWAAFGRTVHRGRLTENAS